MSELQKFVKKQTAKYSDISCRKIYGLDAFYLSDKPFIVISADEKIVIKIEDYEVKNTFLKIPHSSQWLLNEKVMENWFILPDTFNKKKSKLAPVLELTSKALLQPRKEKKKRTKKPKAKKQISIQQNKQNLEKPNSILNKIFKFLS